MTFDQFITKYLATKVDWDKAYGGQCVDLFRQYVNDVLKLSQPRSVNGAADFWTNYDSDPVLNKNFDKIPNTPTGVPQKGDVMFWNKKAGGGFGHVSIFIEGDVNGFMSLDQNWPTLSLVTKTKHTYTNVYGWLHPKNTNSPIQEQPTMTDQEKKDIESMKNLRAYNGVWYESKNVIASFEELKKETEKLATAINDKDTVISKLGMNLLTQKEDMDSLTQKLSIAEDELAKKEELRDKWYRLYQQSQESLKTAKDQAAHYQKQCTDARKSSYEFATVKELLLEIAKKILK